MFRISRFSVLILTTTFLFVDVPPAYAILVFISSVKNIPFSTSYPEPARQQVRAALDSENGEFIKGHSINAISHLHFQGDTTALNEMLKRLAACPGVAVHVSFQTVDDPYDWKITHDAGSMNFQVIVNMQSKQIALEHLVIPPARGPDLKR